MAAAAPASAAPIVADGDEKRATGPTPISGSTSATGTVVLDDGTTDPQLEAGIKETDAPAPPKPLGFQVPDGGLDAWLVVVGGWLVLFCTFGLVNAFGVYQTYYVRVLEKTDSQVAWIGSVQLWLQLGSGLLIGKLIDEGHGKKLLLAGAVFYVFCIFMLSLCKEYYQVFLAQGLGMGIGLGVLFLLALSVIPQWFSRRRALATGIVVSGSSVGGICFPIMINNLLESHGFAYTVRATGYLVIGCLSIACVLIKFRIPGRKHRPAHMQLPPPDIKAIARHKAYLIATLGGFFIMWGLFLPVFYMQTFAELHGMNANLAFYLISILNGASVFGRILPNFFADIYGSFNMAIACCSAVVVLIFVWPTAQSAGGIIVFAILYGFFSGAYVSILPAAYASLSTHVGEIGVRIGYGWAFVAFAGLTGPPIQGALLGTFPEFHWWRPVGFAGASVAVGVVLLAVARHLHAREKGTQLI